MAEPPALTRRVRDHIHALVTILPRSLMVERLALTLEMTVRLESVVTKLNIRSGLSRLVHSQKNGGSNPSPAINIRRGRIVASAVDCKLTTFETSKVRVLPSPLKLSPSNDDN